MAEILPGDIIGYLQMCQAEGTQLQRGMNFRIAPTYSVFLMSLRANAPYADRIEEDGRVLIYEGHDASKTPDAPAPKTVDQPLLTPRGGLTQNGKFFRATEQFKNGEIDAEPVRVYEKIKDGIWTYAGLFRLVDAWLQEQGGRQVCKFRLEMADVAQSGRMLRELDHNRIIPAAVKLAVWQRDQGKCTQCGSSDNLHFDHVLPFSKGGSSLVAENIQLLCARHNLLKRDRIDA